MKRESPSAARFLLADNIQEQSGGKLLVVGLYSGDVVVLQGEMPKEVPEQFHGLALPGLYILVTFVDGVGDFDVGVRIYDPNGTPLGPKAVMKAKLVKGKSQNFVVPLVPFPVTAFGKYKIELDVDSKMFKYIFTVQHQDPNATLPSTRSKSKTVKKVVKPVGKRSQVARSRR